MVQILLMQLSAQVTRVMMTTIDSPTTTETEPIQRTLEEILPPYTVILHNDDHNSMEYVVDALVKSVPSLSAEEAVSIMLEAHNARHKMTPWSLFLLKLDLDISGLCRQREPSSRVTNSSGSKITGNQPTTS